MERSLFRKFRTSVAAIAAVSLVSLTAACSSTPTNEAQDGPVEIRFSWWGNEGGRS